MSTNSIPVIKFLFREELKVLGDALNLGPGFDVEDFSNSNDLSTYLSTVPAGLIVTSLYDRNDLIQIATFMKLGKKIAKDCSIKIVVFNFSRDRNFEKAIAKLGILDIVEPNINTKALKFKIDFWMKSLNAQVKSSAAANPQKIKSLDQNKSAEKKGPEAGGINWLEPLELEDDVWLLKQDSDCKKVLSKWLVRLLGPSPYIGQWTEVNNGIWRFDFKEGEKDMFVPNEGAWFFSGDQKPDFVWKENVWLISGDNFDLYFKNSQETFSRLNCKNKNINVCKNSMFAETKEDVIIESFDKELVFKREAEKLEDMEGKSQTDELNGNLEGKNKTDEIDGSPLEGKSKAPADRSGNMKGKMEGQDFINNENLEQKTLATQKKSHWNNRNTYQEEQGAGPLGVNSEKHRNGENLERENKDQEHKKHYNNHNEAEQYEAGELGKGLDGKSSTDKIASHYGRQNTSSETRAEVEKAERALQEAKTPEARGKAQKAMTEAKAKAEKESKEFEEKETRELGGKSSTDKLDSHYGRPKKPTEAREDVEKAERALQEAKTPAAREKAEKALEKAKELAGKSSTDKLDSHYSRSQKEDLPEVSPREHFDRSRKSPEAQEKEKKKFAESENDREQGSRKGEAHAKIRKDESANSEEGPQKTSSDKNSEGENDQSLNVENPEQARSRGAEVLPINKTREEKQKSEEEKALDKLTEDAKVVSVLIHNGKRITCGLDDFFGDTIIFHTDDMEILTASDVNLDLKFKFLEKDTQLKIHGNVSTIEADGEGKNFVTIQLSNENTKAFESFMRLYEIRQKNVTEFLKKAKGA